MFSGIVEKIGIIKELTADKLVIHEPSIAQELNISESIAVNGICLTIVDIYREHFVVEISPETMYRTNLKDLNKIVSDKVIEILDHSLIQDNEWFKGKQPSTENLVQFIWHQILPDISLPAKLHCIKLRETGTIFTEYYGDEI